MAELKRTLNLTEVVFFGVGSILGAGIYALIGKVAGFAGNLLWLAFIIASLAALASAFSYSELSSVFPGAGGEYIYAKESMGKKMGVFLGTVISLNGVISGATVSLGFAGYLSQLLDTPHLIAAVGILILIFCVNATGIRQSSWVNIIFTIIEFGGLLFVIYCAGPKIGSVNYLEGPPGAFNGLMTAAALSFFAYLGFEEIVKLGAETKDPESTIPKALFLAALIVIVVYVIVSFCAISVMTPEELERSHAPLADIVKSRFGRTGATIITIIALFSTSNTILSNMLGSSRVVLSMAEENKFLKRFSVISSKNKTPIAALLLVVVIMALFALIGKIQVVALIANFFIFITFLTVNISVIVLRITRKDMKRPFRIPGNIKNIPLISIFGILITLMLIGYTIYGLAHGAKI